MDFAQNPGLTAQHYFDLSKKKHIARAVSYGRSPGDQNDLPGFFREICKSRKFSGRFYPPLTAVLFFESADSVLRGLESGDYLLCCLKPADSFSLLRSLKPADSFSLLRSSASVD